jgi:flavin reductase (DIM6/NTAB) family NADH-FMN oxidoreductase RutF
VLTARDAAGTDHGMTVSAFCSLSLEPPLVLACIERSTEMYGVLAVGSQVVFNVLAAHQEFLSRRFSEGEGSGRFDGIGFGRGTEGIVILDDVLAFLECEVVDRCQGGDHDVFFLRVERAETREMRPLLYYRGGYAQLER